MAKKTTKGTGPANARQAKIQAAQKSGGGGANKIVVATVVLVVAIVAVVAGVVWSENQRQSAIGTSTATPAGATMGEGYRSFADVTLKPGAPTVDLYEDFQCPVCGQFEAAVGPTVDELAKEGKIKLVYHVLNFLDDKTGAKNSTPAGNGAFCAAADGKFQAFHDAVYGAQADEGTDVTDTELDAWAQQAGITGDALTTWKSCVADGTYTKYIASVNDAAFKISGFSGTPTVMIDGKMQDLGTVATPQGFTKAVEDATT
ncbi:DsbA family protein [Phycicoccus flavus]|uniref:DsbA family protein n=1 Tax=Phycicoccus flavus TaxID=2502783 RepID=UPI000FEBD8EC|nr:thioredoxin domain-containing protein [Phycicoccus flavus]NHA67225.1 thioredoxin domain-containing protein [Phycicoccus flavus]